MRRLGSVMSTSVRPCMVCRLLATSRPAAVIRRLLLNGNTRYPRFFFNAPPLSVLAWADLLKPGITTMRFSKCAEDQPGAQEAPYQRKAATGQSDPRIVGHVE